MKIILKFNLTYSPDWREYISLLSHSYLHYVWRKFWNWSSETPQIGLIILIYCHINTFTMVKENFDISPSETLQIGLIIFIIILIPLPWLKKILKFDLTYSPDWREYISLLLHSYLHYRWRKFWKLTIWNTPDWLDYSYLSSY